jgi:GrpB-like predicted nucleotidyltransferase (UPF0157 family)
MAIVVPYDPTWPQRFQAASAEILAATDHLFLRLEHIGSTAKPTIDMMASVRRLLDGHAAQPALAALGYELADTGMRERLFFQRLARPGVSAHHLHGDGRLAGRRDAGDQHHGLGVHPACLHAVIFPTCRWAVHRDWLAGTIAVSVPPPTECRAPWGRWAGPWQQPGRYDPGVGNDRASAPAAIRPCPRTSQR